MCGEIAHVLVTCEEARQTLRLPDLLDAAHHTGDHARLEQRKEKEGGR